MPRKTNASAGRSAQPRADKLQGEGDYVAGRRFQAEQRSFAAEEPVGRRAHEAAQALTGPAGPELERARRRAAKGAPRGRRKKNAGGDSHPHTEDNLDHGLKETFPASDPVSISPGAD